MLDFFKKKKTDENKGMVSQTSLDDLPPAPKPNSVTVQMPSTNEPYIPPVPDEIKEPISPFGNPKQPEELEPLPESPNISSELTAAKPPREELNEPAPIKQQSIDQRPVSPKDIDPRDHFDDLIKPNENSELPASDQNDEKIDTSKETKSKWSLGDKTNTPPVSVSDDYFSEYKDNLELPSAEELAQVLKPKTETSFSNNKPSSVLPPKIPEQAKESIIQTQELPSFNKEINQDMVPNSDSEFALPDVHFGVMPQKELSIYVSVNDYALVTQNMKKLMKFFKTSGKMLNQADNPEKVHVISELYKELNNAQKKLMDIDKKLFERDSYGA